MPKRNAGTQTPLCWCAPQPRFTRRLLLESKAQPTNDRTWVAKRPADNALKAAIRVDAKERKVCPTSRRIEDVDVGAKSLIGSHEQVSAVGKRAGRSEWPEMGRY